MVLFTAREREREREIGGGSEKIPNNYYFRISVFGYGG